MDPTKETRQIPKIDPKDFKPKPRDTKRKKTEDEIPRVEDIHEETIPHPEYNRNNDHDEEALKIHRVRVAKEELEEARNGVPTINLNQGD